MPFLFSLLGEASPECGFAQSCPVGLWRGWLVLAQANYDNDDLGEETSGASSE